MGNRIWLQALCLVASVWLAPQTLAAAGTAAKDPDPWQGLNRPIHSFNRFLDRWILKPVAQGYDFIMPDPMQRGVSNAFDNIRTPWVAVNQFLQGKPRYGMSDLARFGVNTTLGLAGFVDVATKAGIGKHQEDFGQTLQVWGVARGPYFVMPLLGPSTVTDTIGFAVDTFFNPIRYIEDDTTRYSLIALYIIDRRARLLEAESLISGDEYLFLRDAYLQSRQFLVDDGVVEEDPFLDEDFDFEDEDEDF